MRYAILIFLICAAFLLLWSAMFSPMAESNRAVADVVEAENDIMTVNAVLKDFLESHQERFPTPTEWQLQLSVYKNGNSNTYNSIHHCFYFNENLSGKFISSVNLNSIEFAQCECASHGTSSISPAQFIAHDGELLQWIVTVAGDRKLMSVKQIISRIATSAP